MQPAIFLSILRILKRAFLFFLNVSNSLYDFIMLSATIKVKKAKKVAESNNA